LLLDDFGVLGKETFGVSGPHIKIRFFGGWEYKPEDFSTCDVSDDNMR